MTKKKQTIYGREVFVNLNLGREILAGSSKSPINLLEGGREIM